MMTLLLILSVMEKTYGLLRLERDVIRSVSYTHLDVYKRQDVPDPISADSLFSDEFSDCFCTDVTEAYTYESVLLTSLTAVSYTHLNTSCVSCN